LHHFYLDLANASFHGAALSGWNTQYGAVFFSTILTKIHIDFHVLNERMIALFNPLYIGAVTKFGLTLKDYHTLFSNYNLVAKNPNITISTYPVNESTLFTVLLTQI